jgi:hypothetical protein
MPGEVNPLRPGQGGGHARAVHCASVGAHAVSAVSVRGKDVVAPVELRGVREHGPLEALERVQCVILDHHIEVAAVICGASLDEVIFRDGRERIAAVPLRQQTQRGANRQQRLGRAGGDVQRMTQLR